VHVSRERKEVVKLDDETKAALLMGIVAAVSEELTRWLLERLTATVRKCLEAKRKSWRAKHFATRN